MKGSNAAQHTEEMRIRKYYGQPVAAAVDLLCYVSTYPFLLAVSSLLSCYHTTSEERGRHLLKGFHYAVLGPALASVSLLTLAPYLAGQALWVALCHCPWVDKTDFARVDFGGGGEVDSSRQKVFTMVTSNVLLGFDYLGKAQNMSFVYDRLYRMMEVLKR